MQKTTVYLDSRDYISLKRLAARNGRAPAELVREAVAEYAAKHAPARRARSVGGFAGSRSDLAERAEELLAGMGTDATGRSAPARTPAKQAITTKKARHR